MKFSEKQLELVLAALASCPLKGADLATADKIQRKIVEHQKQMQQQREAAEKLAAERDQARPTKVPDFRQVKAGTMVYRRKDSPGYTVGGSWENFGMVIGLRTYKDPLCGTVAWPVVHWQGQAVAVPVNPLEVDNLLYDGSKLPMVTCDGRYSGEVVLATPAFSWHYRGAFTDQETRLPCIVRVRTEAEGFEVYLDGLGSCNMDPGFGAVAFFYQKNGVPFLMVHGDINEEEPTHVIDLSKALETNRKET